MLKEHLLIELQVPQKLGKPKKKPKVGSSGGGLFLFMETF